MQADDDLLLQQMKDGHEGALKLFHDRYARFLYLEALQLLGREDEAKDVVQDFFADFWHKKRYQSVQGNVKGYFYKAVRNLALDILKSRKSKALLYHRMAAAADTFSDHNDPAENRQLRQELGEAVRALPTQQAKVFDMAIIAGKKRKEISSELGLKDNTVKTHLAEAIKTLRKKLIHLR